MTRLIVLLPNLVCRVSRLSLCGSQSQLDCALVATCATKNRHETTCTQNTFERSSALLLARKISTRKQTNPFHPLPPLSQSPLYSSNPYIYLPSLTKSPVYHPAAPQARPTAPRSLPPDPQTAAHTSPQTAPRHPRQTPCPRSHARGPPRRGWPS